MTRAYVKIGYDFAANIHEDAVIDDANFSLYQRTNLSGVYTIRMSQCKLSHSEKLDANRCSTYNISIR
jgi:hypothetical protein